LGLLFSGFQIGFSKNSKDFLMGLILENQVTKFEDL
jgi:hypothetical protein